MICALFWADTQWYFLTDVFVFPVIIIIIDVAISGDRIVIKKQKKKIAASSMLHEAKIAYYAFDAAILFASSIGPAVAKAT